MIMRTLLFLCLLAAFFTLFTGETPPAEVLEGIWRRITGSSSAWNPLLEERLPRLLVLSMTGASLAIAGVIMQSVFANPLASPTILGISGGGSLAVIAVLYAGWHLISPLVLPSAAFAGCLFALAGIYFLSRWHGPISTPFLLLLGVAFSTLIFALQSAIVFALRTHWELSQMISDWLAGSTFFLSWQHVHLQFPLAFLGITGTYMFKGELDLLSLGDEEALHLGVEVDRVRWRLFGIVALLVAGSLATIGEIPFLGLVIPHIGRRLTGASHARLITTSALLGMACMLLLDLLIRQFPGFPLSISHLAGILGGIFFFTLLIKRQSDVAYS
jgi:iron complex transport system permease protein